MAAAHNRPCVRPALDALYATVERVLAFDPVVAMNAGFADVPVEDRGWPEMRKALVAMHADDPLAAELLREASRCEVLGFYAGHPEDLSLEDKGLWPELVSDEEPGMTSNPWSWEQSAISILLPHLADLRKAALLLKDHAMSQGRRGPLKIFVRCDVSLHSPKSIPR